MSRISESKTSWPSTLTGFGDERMKSQFSDCHVIIDNGESSRTKITCPVAFFFFSPFKCVLHVIYLKAGTNQDLNKLIEVPV